MKRQSRMRERVGYKVKLSDGKSFDGIKIGKGIRLGVYWMDGANRSRKFHGDFGELNFALIHPVLMNFPEFSSRSSVNLSHFPPPAVKIHISPIHNICMSVDNPQSNPITTNHHQSHPIKIIH